MREPETSDTRESGGALSMAAHSYHFTCAFDFCARGHTREWASANERRAYHRAEPASQSSSGAQSVCVLVIADTRSPLGLSSRRLAASGPNQVAC